MDRHYRCSPIANSISSSQPLFSNTFQENPSSTTTSVRRVDCSGRVAYLNFKSRGASSEDGILIRGAAWDFPKLKSIKLQTNVVLPFMKRRVRERSISGLL